MKEDDQSKANGEKPIGLTIYKPEKPGLSETASV